MAKPRWPLQKSIPVLTICLLIVSAALLSLRKIHLVTADLGRHIANGRFLLEDSGVLLKNFYSYSFPDSPFINHHWGSGLIFYAVHKWLDFSGLSILHMIMTTSAFGLILVMSKRLTSVTDTALAALVVLPMVVSRTEIRPEVFSYTLTAIFYFMLSGWRTRQFRSEWLCVLPLLMILWVNLHIYFFMGPFLIAAFAFDTRDKSSRRELGLIFFLTCIATFVNPLSWEIALYPLRIFENYGYMVAENQSVPFFWHRDMVILGFGSFHAATLALGLSLALLATLKMRFSRAFVAIAFITWGLALTAIRNFALFGLCAIPVLAMVGYILDATRLRLIWRLCLLFIALAGQSYDWSRATPGIRYGWGPGLTPDVNRSANFFKREHLQGPIFNNYDIGGYLIYHLFPDERVFVDNRPEAYPKGFFENTYGPMQEDPKVWNVFDEKYRFNTIFYYLHDNTPAGQTFLIDRVRDPNWVPIYVDQEAIILVRNADNNRSIIDKFALPPQMFGVSSKR